MFQSTVTIALRCQIQYNQHLSRVTQRLRNICPTSIHVARAHLFCDRYGVWNSWFMLTCSYADLFSGFFVCRCWTQNPSPGSRNSQHFLITMRGREVPSKRGERWRRTGKQGKWRLKYRSRGPFMHLANATGRHNRPTQPAVT